MKNRRVGDRAAPQSPREETLLAVQLGLVCLVSFLKPEPPSLHLTCSLISQVSVSMMKKGLGICSSIGRVPAWCAQSPVFSPKHPVTRYGGTCM